MRARVGLGVVAVCGFARMAHAAEAQAGVARAPTDEASVVARPQSEPPQRPASRWYGAPILIGDGIAHACLLAAVVSEFDSKPVNYACLPPGVLGYALVGPITHLARGNWGRSLLSLGTRGVLPIVTLAAVTHGGGGCAEQGDCVETALGSLFAGMLAATIVDAALLAREPRPQPRVGLELSPTFAASRQHAFIGATGSF